MRSAAAKSRFLHTFRPPSFQPDISCANDTNVRTLLTSEAPSPTLAKPRVSFQKLDTRFFSLARESTHGYASEIAQETREEDCEAAGAHTRTVTTNSLAQASDGRCCPAGPFR